MTRYSIKKSNLQCIGLCLIGLRESLSNAFLGYIWKMLLTESPQRTNLNAPLC